MNPERVVADLESRARDLAARSRELRDRLRRAHVTHRSPDGVVTATVAPNGSLRHIEFSPAAAGWPAARLGEVVMDTVRRAQEQAAREATAIVEPQFGGTAAMDFLTGALPPVEPTTTPVPDGDDVPLPRSLWAPEDEAGPGAAVR